MLDLGYKIHYPSVPSIVKNCTSLIRLGICIKTKNERDNPFKALLNHPSIERLDIAESIPLTKTHIEYLSKVVKTMPKLNTLYIDEKYIDSLIVPETIQVEKTDWCFRLFCAFEL